MDVRIKPYNSVYDVIDTDDRGLLKTISDNYSFFVPGAHFMPKYKNGIWDGYIRLMRGNKLYCGLRESLTDFLDAKNIEYEVDPKLSALSNFSLAEAQEWVSEQKFTMEPYDYQLDAFCKGVRSRRKLFLSPTNSGKSFIIHMLVRFLNKKTLIVVPRTALVLQIAKDFATYDSGDEIVSDLHLIYDGEDKVTDKRITITTWQSVYKMPESYFNKFDVVIGDEAHNFKAKSLVGIMEKCTTARWKFGFTGTLDGSQTNKLILEGLFGKVEQVTTNAELIERKISADINIKALVLQHSEEARKLYYKTDYDTELDYLITYEPRNKFIVNLAHSLKGNVMILFRMVEKQGEVLKQLAVLKNKTNRPIYYVSGKVPVEERDALRDIIEKETNAIIIASVGTFSEGINIKQLNHLIFASPSKSRVKVLQSIGRGLRTSKTKTEVTLYDIADDLSHKKRKNYTLNHYIERIGMYNEEKFPYKQYRVEI